MQIKSAKSNMNDDGLTAIIKRENTAIKSRDRTHELQGFPEARRVICESREATLLSLNVSSGDGWGAEGINRSAQCGRSALGAL